AHLPQSMTQERPSVLRWMAFIFLPPLVGIAAFAAVFALADQLLYRGVPGSEWFENSWALDNHIWPILFAWLLLLFHGMAVLPTAIVQTFRRRETVVPLG